MPDENSQTSEHLQRWPKEPALAIGGTGKVIKSIISYEQSKKSALVHPTTADIMPSTLCTAAALHIQHSQAKTPSASLTLLLPPHVALAASV
jgi:hypothetical protein